MFADPLRRPGAVIKPFGAFSDQSPANETLQPAQRRMVLRRGETERFADGQRAPGAPDPMHIIFRVFGKVIVDDM